MTYQMLGSSSKTLGSMRILPRYSWHENNEDNGCDKNTATMLDVMRKLKSC